MRKMRTNLLLSVLSVFLFLSAIPVLTNVNVHAEEQEAKTITNEDGVRLSKEANLVEGSLNEWEIDLRLDFEAEALSHDIVVIIDTSGSMTANQSPRLDQAKEAAVNFMNTVLSNQYKDFNRVALITYGTGPIIQSNFTNSKENLNSIIRNLRADGGTFTQAAIRDARNILETSTADRKSIVLLTDGAPSFGYGLSEQGVAKYQSLPTYLTNDARNHYDVSYNGNTWTHKQVHRGDRQKPSYRLENKAEAQFLESDFNVIDNFGGHGSQGYRYLPELESESEYYFLNLYASALAEAGFAKASGFDFFTVGLGLGNDAEALEMLLNMASDQSKYFAVDDQGSSELTEVFANIANDLNFPFANMRFYDPMGDAVDYAGQLHSLKGNLDEHSFNEATRAFDIALTKDNFVYNAEENKYEFHIRYRVKTNENAITILEGNEKQIRTNGDASFSYTKGSKINTSLFPSPSVIPTILEVSKQVEDADGVILPLEYEAYQRAYHYTLKNNGDVYEESALSFDNQKDYYVLHDNIDYTISEYKVDYDDLSRFDVSYQFEDQINTNGTFSLNPHSGMNKLIIINRERDDYVYDDFNITKSVNSLTESGFAEQKEDLEYKIRISNAAKGAFIRNLFIQDSLENVKDYLDFDDNQVLAIFRDDSKTEETYTIRDLKKGFSIALDKNESVEIVFIVKVKENLNPIPKVLLNSASASVYKNKKTADAEIETRLPMIKSEKKVVDDNQNGYAEPNEALHYTIKITNSGDVSFKNLKIQDPLTELIPISEDLDNVSFTIDHKSYPLSDLQNGFTLKELKAHTTVEINFTIVLKDDLDPMLTPQITNIATIDDKDVEVTIPSAKADLTSKKTVVDDNENGYAEANEVLHYTIAIENPSNVEKSKFIVKDDLKDIINVLDEDYLNGKSKVVLKINDMIETYSINDLREGIEMSLDAKTKAELKFSVKVKASFDALEVSSLRNVAEVDGDELEAVIKTGTPRLLAHKTVEDENKNGFAEAGEQLTYTLSIKNTGNVEKKDLFVQDDLKELLNVSNVQDIKTLNSVFINSSEKHEFKTLEDLMSGFTIDLAAHRETTITFSIRLNEDLTLDSLSTIKNIAVIGEETPTVDIDVGEADIIMKKTVIDENQNGFAEAKERLDYTLFVENQGNVAEAVFIQDDLKDLLDHIEDPTDSLFTINNKEESMKKLLEGFTVELKPHEHLEIKFSVTVKEDFDSEEIKTLRNVASINEEHPSVEIPTGKAILSLSKDVVDDNKNGFAESGELLHYTIRIENHGEVSETILIKDSLEFIEAYIDTSVETEVLINEEAYRLHDLQKGIKKSIEANGLITITFSVKVKDDFDAEHLDVFKNVVTVNDLQAEATIPSGEASFRSYKEVSDENGNGFAEAGERLDYHIKIVNEGSVFGEVFIQDNLEDLLPHIKSIKDGSVFINDEERELRVLTKGFTLGLESKEVVDIRFTVVINDDFNADDIKSLRNRASIGEDTPSVEIPSGKAIIEAEKLVFDENGNGYAEKGEVLHYTISIKNRGNVSKEIVVQDDLNDLLPYILSPEETILFVNEDERSIIDLMNGFMVNLDANEEINLKFDVKLRDDLSDDEVSLLKNIAVIDDEEVEVIIPYGFSHIASTKNVSDENENGIAEANELLHYTIEVENKGNIKKEIFIKDDLANLKDYIALDDSLEFVMNGKNHSLEKLKKGFFYTLEPNEVLSIDFSVVTISDLEDRNIVELLNIAFVDDEEVSVSIPIRPKPPVQPGGKNPKEDDISNVGFKSPRTGLNTQVYFFTLILVTSLLSLSLLIRRKRKTY